MNEAFKDLKEQDDKQFNDIADKFNFITRKQTIYENDIFVDRALKFMKELPLEYVETALKMYKKEIDDLKQELRQKLSEKGYESLERMSSITKEKYKIEKKLKANFSLAGTDKEALKKFLEKYDKSDILTKQFTFTLLDNEDDQVKQIKEAVKEFCDEGFTANSNTIKSVLKQIFLEKKDKPTKEVNFTIFEDIESK